MRPIDALLLIALIALTWAVVFKESECRQITEIRHVYQMVPDDIKVMRGMK